MQFFPFEATQKKSGIIYIIILNDFFFFSGCFLLLLLSLVFFAVHSPNFDSLNAHLCKSTRKSFVSFAIDPSIYRFAIRRAMAMDFVVAVHKWKRNMIFNVGG
jgi:hypothetical protein